MSEPTSTEGSAEDATAPGLLARARAGDAEAFGALFEAQAARVLLYVRLRLSADLGQRLEPEDVLQETGLSAFASIGGFEPRGRGSFGRWLCRVAENRLRDAAEHHGARKRRPEGEREAITVVLDRVRLSVTGPATAAQRGEGQARLRERLEALPGEEREVLLGRYFRGASAAELARELGRSESAVRRLLGRATEQLGRELGEAGA